MASGQVKSVPLSSLVDVDYTTTLGSVKRKDFKRTIILRSNVLTSQGFTPTAVNQQIKSHLDKFTGQEDGVTIRQTGEGEQQAETGAFLGQALVVALMIILFILVLQFNSVSKPVIILTEIIFSLIGVFLGFALTGMQVSIAFTGLGIVGLAGIVVKNGILVIEFADELRARGMKTREAVIEAGKTRIIPVMLQFYLYVRKPRSADLDRRRQCQILETAGMDDHFRIDLGILHDADRGTEYVHYRRTFEKADEKVIRWKVGVNAWHPPAHNFVHADDDLYQHCA